jgi:hypothetical protein
MSQSFGDTSVQSEKMPEWTFKWFWGMPELWWYDLAEVICYNSEIDFRKQDASTFWVEGKGHGFFGVRFGCGKVLKKNMVYNFELACHPEPDRILFESKIVWQKGRDIYADDYAKFSYVPSDNNEIPQIAIIKNSTAELQRVFFNYTRYFAYRIKVDAGSQTDKRPQYPLFEMPAELQLFKIDPSIACSSLESVHTAPLENYVAAPLPETPYPPSKVKFIEYSVSLKRSPEAFISLLPYLENNQVDVVFAGSWNPKVEDIEKYAHVLTDTDFDFAMFQFTKKLSISEQSINNYMDNCIAAAKKLLELNPKAKIYLVYPEYTNMFGFWQGGITQSPMRKYSPEMDKIFEQGGCEAFETFFSFFQKLNERFRTKVGSNARILVYSDRAGFSSAYTAKLGADIVMTKNIHRQNVNIAVANSRGAASAYDLGYGMDFDSWDRNYQKSYSTREMKQVLMTYFHSGAEYIMDESIHAFSADYKKVSAIGKTWFDFMRYAKLHPQRGIQQVDIAVMRGLGDEWSRIAGPSASWEAARESHEVTTHPYFSDYNLLNIFFSNFGSYYRTFPDRLCTGTPYGAVNFIPWDIKYEKLKKYRLVVYTGKSNCMTKSVYENLVKYVENGGTLVFAAGHLRKRDGSFFTKDLTRLCGVKIDGLFTLKSEPKWDRNRVDWVFDENNKQKYISLETFGENTEIFTRFKNCDPMVVLKRHGQGKTYLFATEYLTEFSSDIAIRIIMSQAEKIRKVDFVPDNDRLEYTVAKKADSFVLTIMNHGNIGFPSGNGRATGIWKGKVKIDLNRFKISLPIAVYKICYTPGDKRPFVLEKVNSIIINNELMFECGVDDFAEFIIGPAESVERDFYMAQM